MDVYDKEHPQDEIDITRLLLLVWRGKFYIILSVIASIYLASQYLQNAEKKYTVVYKLKPVEESGNQPSQFNRLGGLASFAGLNLPSPSSDGFKIFKELLISNEVAELVFTNKELVQNIYSSEWNVSQNNFSMPTKSKFMKFVSGNIKKLTGKTDQEYIPPNPRRLAIFISEGFKIIEDKKTGFLKISSETSRPDLMVSLILKAVEAADTIMRQRYIDFSTEPLAFYKEKLRIERSVELRVSLAELISSGEQKLMLASKGKYFSAEPYIKPTISLYPTSPRAINVLFISLVLGVLLGMILMLMRVRK